MSAAEASYDQQLTRTERRERGSFYTPMAMVQEIVDELLGQRLSTLTLRDDGSARLRVLDPAAGDGRFLLACADWLADHASQRGFDRTIARRAIVRRCLVGIERDKKAAAHARAALGQGADTRVAEALFDDATLGERFDVVLGNPPYLRSVALKRSDLDLWQKLRGALVATSYREWDLYAAFIEKSFDWVRPGGDVGLVVPSRWQRAAFAAPLRKKLAAAMSVRKIVDFGDKQMFESATTYTSLLFMTGAARRNDSVIVTRAGERGIVATGTLGDSPWTLPIGKTAQTLARLRAAGPALGDIADIKKGAGTNADPVFLLTVEQRTSLEPNLLVPCVRGRDVTTYAAETTRHALFPYDGDRLLTPEELARFPKTAAYLQRHREQLAARESGRFAGATYYCWGRPQNLLWLRHPSPKIIVPDATRTPRAALDIDHRLVIDTAYAIRPHNPTHIGLILAVLNSPIVLTWLTATGIPLRGGYTRLKTQTLSTLPIPDPNTQAARTLATQAITNRVPADRIVALYTSSQRF